MKKIFAMVLSALLLAACNSAPAYQGVEKKLATIDVQYYANTAKSAETGLIYAELYTRTAAEKEFIISSGFGADSIFYLGDSFFAAVKGEKQYVFNAEGKRIFDDGFESCHYYPDSLFILKQDGRYLIGMSDEYLAGEKGKFIVGGPYDKLVIGQHNEVFYCQQGIWSGFNAGQTLVLPGECLKIFALQAKDSKTPAYLALLPDNTWQLIKAGIPRRLSKQKAEHLLKSGTRIWGDETIGGYTVDKLF